MRVTLKKFTKNPYPMIKKAPVIITVNREPRYAIIPYVVYKTTLQQKDHGTIHQNTISQHMQRKSIKHSWLWKLLFT